MTRGVRLYLVGSFVLVSLAGCGRGFFQTAEREPWRAEAEIACLKSGAVRESAEVVRIDPISGPGICGADFPLKVAALGEASTSYGFADDDLRPPGNIGNQPRWPISPPRTQTIRSQRIRNLQAIPSPPFHRAQTGSRRVARSRWQRPVSRGKKMISICRLRLCRGRGNQFRERLMSAFRARHIRRAIGIPSHTRRVSSPPRITRNPIGFRGLGRRKAIL